MVGIDPKCAQPNPTKFLVAERDGVGCSPMLVPLNSSRQEVDIRLERRLESFFPVHDLRQNRQRVCVCVSRLYKPGENASATLPSFTNTRHLVEESTNGNRRGLCTGVPVSRSTARNPDCCHVQQRVGQYRYTASGSILRRLIGVLLGSVPVVIVSTSPRSRPSHTTAKSGSIPRSVSRSPGVLGAGRLCAAPRSEPGWGNAALPFFHT